jgi:CheY-like chemotaxis protein
MERNPITIAEDEEHVHEILGHGLTPMGFTVESSADGPGGLELSRRGELEARDLAAVGKRV